MLIPIFNACKSAWSRVNDWIKRGSPRVPVPPLTTPQAVADYIGARFIYTGDPLGGAADFYLHPERLHAAMLEGPAAVKRLSVDCDDLASLAYLMLSKVPDCSPQLYTLEDSSGKWGHHVVCAYTWRGDVHGVLDTNGIARLLSPGPDELCRHFTGIYRSLGYTYTAAVPTRYPF